MKKYLIGYDKSKVQNVIFFDIQDFEAQTIRNMTVLTFSEDDIDYTYTGTNGVDFKEVSKAAPDFYYYEVLDEKECKKRGINTNQNQSGSSSSSSGTKVFNIGNGIVVTLKSGKQVNILDPNDMKNLTPAEVKEVEKELKKQLNGLTGQAKSNIGQIFGSSKGGSKGKYKVTVDFTNDQQNPTISLPNGDTYTKDDLENMDINDVIDLAENEGIDISDILSEVNAEIFKGTKGKITLTLDKATNIFGSSSSSSSSSGGCGGGYSSGGGCGGSYRSGC